MYDFKTLVCYYCNQVVLELPVQDVERLDGLNFMCECCGHLNMLKHSKLDRNFSKDELFGISDYFDIYL